jgi:hypothetical protein
VKPEYVLTTGVTEESVVPNLSSTSSEYVVKSTFSFL